jgi:predicted metalloprotease
VKVRRTLAVLAAALLLIASGCGGEDLREAREQAEADLQARVDDLRERARQAGDEFTRAVRQVLDDIRKAVPEASLPAPQVERESQIAQYMTKVLRSVDGYWTRTLSTSGLEPPRVRYAWIPRGRSALTSCQVIADSNAAFYCPADDTIYIAERFAHDVYNGIGDRFPGERAGAGNAVGEFGLAYVVAHEYAHNVQFELGFYELQDPRDGVKAFELQADCMAGLWGNAVYREGRYDDRDVEEAISTAQAAGDFDYGTAQHHGTPDERRTAWLAGFQTGDPAQCRRYVPGT